MRSMIELKLTGPRGDNPLGFLTVLGVMAALEDAGVEAAVRWEALTASLRFVPPMTVADPGQNAGGEADQARPEQNTSGMADVLVDLLWSSLHREPPSDEAAKRLSQAEERMDDLKTQIKNAIEEIKTRGLSRGEKKSAMDREVQPLKQQRAQARKAYLSALQQAGVDPVLALGKDLAATNAEFQDFLGWLFGWNQNGYRRNLDLAAAYGVSDPNAPDERMLPTPWALITGAGHQYFLETVRELMQRCQKDQIRQAVFGPWVPKDERFSLRLDPAEDRRYALMAANPSKGSNKTLTLWGANRLAFEAVRFFTCYPAARGDIAVLGWRPSQDHGFRADTKVRWPLWGSWLSPEEIRPILALPEIWQDSPQARSALRERGIQGVYRSERIQRDDYFNLLPGIAVWMSSAGFGPSGMS